MSGPYLRRRAQAAGRERTPASSPTTPRRCRWPTASSMPSRRSSSSTSCRPMRAAASCARPGGCWRRAVASSSATRRSSPTAASSSRSLHGFPAAYHEPYYKGYLRDDLAAVMRECGFEVESSAPHLVSKVVVGRKPHRARRAARRGEEETIMKRAADRSSRRLLARLLAGTACGAGTARRSSARTTRGLAGAAAR